MLINTINKIDSSIDDVTKYILEDSVFGKNEVSIIRKSDKIIFCVPTQTNCKMGCRFCHLTGTTRKAVNLSGEWLISVVDYLAAIEHIIDQPKDLLISFMGVGEPLLNVNGLIDSISALHNKYANIRFGISTMMPNKQSIIRLTNWLSLESDYKVKIHLSVHGIFNRESIVTSVLDIKSSIGYLQTYNMQTGNPIEYHYTLVNGVNDSIKELQAFNALIYNDGSTIKFLTLSETNGCEKTRLTTAQIHAIFSNNIVEFYDPPGRDIGSSCGMFDKDLYNV